LIGCRRRRDLSVLPLSHQLEIGAKRCRPVPATPRPSAIRAGAGAAAPVGDPGGAGRVPGHPDHLRAVIAVVGRPPVHRRGQELLDVALERLEVDLGELGRVVEIRAEGIGRQPVLVEHLHPQAMGIPVLQRRPVAEGAADPVAAERAFAFHVKRRRVRLVDRLAHRVVPLGCCATTGRAGLGRRRRWAVQAVRTLRRFPSRSSLVTK